VEEIAVGELVGVLVLGGDGNKLAVTDALDVVEEVVVTVAGAVGVKGSLADDVKGVRVEDDDVVATACKKRGGVKGSGWFSFSTHQT
jgi:hypothetical protein